MNKNAFIFQNSQNKAFFSSSAGLVFALSLFFLALIALFTFHRNFIKKESSAYFTLSKKIGITNTLFAKAPSFSEEEIEELRNAEFALNIHKSLKPSFEVYASFFENLSFQTELVFESLPADFYDGPSYQFFWQEGQQNIPIVISADFLRLYNYVYAPMAGLPPVESSNMSMIPIQLTIRANGKRNLYAAQIIGTTDRFNGIFVPPSFLKFANEKHSNSKVSRVEKVIVKLNNEKIRDFEDYLEKNDLDVNKESLQLSSSLSKIFPLFWLVMILTSVVLVIAVSNFWLQWKWILESSKINIQKLYLLGQSPQNITSQVLKSISKYLIVSFLASLGFVALAFYLLQESMTFLGDQVAYSDAFLIHTSIFLIIFLWVYWRLKRFTLSIYQ